METQGLIALAVIIVLLSWIGRSFIWWYYGIDRAVDALERIANNLDRFEQERAAGRAGIRRAG